MKWNTFFILLVFFTACKPGSQIPAPGPAYSAQMLYGKWKITSLHCTDGSCQEVVPDAIQPVTLHFFESGGKNQIEARLCNFVKGNYSVNSMGRVSLSHPSLEKNSCNTQQEVWEKKLFTAFRSHSHFEITGQELRFYYNNRRNYLSLQPHS